MILVDSSVWIAHLRGVSCDATRKLNALDDMADIIVGDLILLEVLQGARHEAHALRIERDMRQFTIVRLLNDSLAVEAARNYRHLRAKGITVRKTIDMIIATFCIANRLSLLHHDRDFDPMTVHLGLEVV